MSIKPILKRLALILLGIGIFFGIELSLRLVWDPPAQTSSLLDVATIDPFQRIGDHFTTRPEFQQAMRVSSFPAEKGKNTKRIFCLGGSATFGYPYEAKHSWPAVLDRALHVLYPSKSIEVVNLGGTSYGTSRVLGILRGIVKYDPDLVIVYSGNNEFVEDSFRPHLMVGPDAGRFWDNLYMGQLLRLLLPESWVARRPERIESDDLENSQFFFSPTVDGQVYRPTRLQTQEVLQRYRENFAEMVQLSRTEGFPILLATVASNIASWSPGNHGEIPTDPKISALWHEKIAIAEQASREVRRKDAIKAYQEALRLFEQNASANFALGTLFLQDGQYESAAPFLLKARDYDPTPVRATGEMNEFIRSLTKTEGLPLVDVEVIAQAVSPGGIPGDQFFIDNVHPTLLGNVHIARAFTSSVPELFPQPASVDTLEPLWGEEFARSGEEPALDANIAFTWGQIYLRKGQMEKAEAMLRSAIGQGYSHPSAKLYLAEVLSRDEQVEEAYELLLETVNRHPDYTEPFPLLARVAARLGKFETAIWAYRRALENDHPEAELFSSLSLLLLKMSSADEAERVARKGLSLFPSDCPLNANLGRVFEWRGALSDAEKIYRGIILTDPGCQAGWENLGILQLNRQSFAEAINTFTEALNMPGSIPTHFLNRGVAYHQIGDREKANADFRAFHNLAPLNFEHIPSPYREEILKKRSGDGDVGRRRRA